MHSRILHRDQSRIPDMPTVRESYYRVYSRLRCTEMSGEGEWNGMGGPDGQRRDFDKPGVISDRRVAYD